MPILKWEQSDRILVRVTEDGRKLQELVTPRVDALYDELEMWLDPDE
jgi:hypothetical protein